MKTQRASKTLFHIFLARNEKMDYSISINCEFTGPSLVLGVWGGIWYWSYNPDSQPFHSKKKFHCPMPILDKPHGDKAQLLASSQELVSLAPWSTLWWTALACPTWPNRKKSLQLSLVLGTEQQYISMVLGQIQVLLNHNGSISGIGWISLKR